MSETFADQKAKTEQPVEYDEPLDLIGDMGFGAAFPGPQTLTINGQKVQVKPWTTDDYTAWCKELTEQMQKGRLARIPKTATAPEEWQIKTNIQETEVTPDDVRGLIYRTSVTQRVIREALMRSNISEEDANKYIKSRQAKANEMLAVVLSGLYTTEEFNRAYRRSMPFQEKSPSRTFGGNSPLGSAAGETPSGTSGDSGEASTGPQSASGSESLLAVNPAA